MNATSSIRTRTRKLPAEAAAVSGCAGQHRAPVAFDRELALKVDYRPVDAVRPSARNARTHSKKQIHKIAASLQQFGFVSRSSWMRMAN
jgi:hypothetical protein